MLLSDPFQAFSGNTVEPRLTDTPQLRTPAIRRTVQEVPNLSP